MRCVLLTILSLTTLLAVEPTSTWSHEGIEVQQWGPYVSDTTGGTLSYNVVGGTTLVPAVYGVGGVWCVDGVVVGAPVAQQSLYSRCNIGSSLVFVPLSNTTEVVNAGWVRYPLLVDGDVVIGIDYSSPEVVHSYPTTGERMYSNGTGTIVEISDDQFLAEQSLLQEYVYYDYRIDYSDGTWVYGFDIDMFCERISMDGLQQINRPTGPVNATQDIRLKFQVFPSTTPFSFIARPPWPEVVHGVELEVVSSTDIDRYSSGPSENRLISIASVVDGCAEFIYRHTRSGEPFVKVFARLVYKHPTGTLWSHVPDGWATPQWLYSPFGVGDMPIDEYGIPISGTALEALQVRPHIVYEEDVALIGWDFADPNKTFPGPKMSQLTQYTGGVSPRSVSILELYYPDPTQQSVAPPIEPGVCLCPVPLGQITPLTSRVENPQLSHIHTATDYQSASGASGCGPCGASSGAGGGLAVDIRFDRIHRYADQFRPGSFGPGVFSNLDIGLNLWNHGESGEIWDPSAASPIPLMQTATGRYVDVKRSAIQGLVLYAADGMTVVNVDAAVTAIATQHDGTVWVFELVQAGMGGDVDRQGRLTAIRDRTGNQVTITYAFPASTTDAVLGSRSRLLEMATAADQRGRQLSFAYGWTCGQPVITALTYPTGATVVYHYSGDIAGVSAIDYPDGTHSSFSTRLDPASQTQVIDYQDAGAEGVHRTKSVYLTLVDWQKADGTRSPQSPNRVRRVVGPTGEPTYLNWLERDGDRVKIYVFEGGGIAGGGRMVRLDTTEGVTDATWIAKQWSFATEPAAWTWEKVADYEADTRFRMGAQTDPLGKSTTYQRDPASGAITGREHRNAAGSVVSSESTAYNGMRLPTRHQDANGLITRSTYDELGNLRFRTEGIVLKPDGETEDASKAVTWEWRYRADGQVLMEIDPLGRVTDYEYDARGFRTAEVSPPDDPLFPLIRARKTWFYDVAGRLEWSRDAANHLTTYLYDARNRVHEVRYGNDSKEVYDYGTGDRANLLMQKTDRDNVVTAFDYDAAGREIGRIEGAQVPALAIATSTTYLEGTDLPQTVIRAGQKIEYVYDTRKRVVETRRWVDGSRYLADSTVFDAADRVAYTQDAFGRRTYSVYDDLDRVTRTIREAIPGGVPAQADLAALARLLGNNPAYIIEETSYDVGGRVLATTDAAGVVTKMGYDRLGRMTDRWEAFGTPVEAHWYWTYDAVGNRETETDPLLRVTRFVYNGRNLLKSQTVAFGTPDAAETQFTYALTGQRFTQTDANDHTTQWIYGNCCDWLEDVIDPAGYYTHYTYTPGGLAESVRDASLHLTRTDYDGLKRPFAVTNGDNEITTTIYDDNLLDADGLSGIYGTELSRIANRVGHRAVAVRNHMQETVVQVTDGLGRTVMVIDPERHVTQTVYDQVVIGSGGVPLVETATTDPMNHTVRQRVDGLGRVREVVDAQLKVSIISSDTNGNRRHVSDPLGHGPSFEYDDRNRQTGSSDGAGNTTSTEYDLVGNVLLQFDGLTHKTEFTYTARNQKKTEKDRLGNTTAFTYDPAGNLLTISDAENEAKKATVTPEVYEAGKTRYTYTERNQLETERFPGETAARSYTYHPNGLLKTRKDQRHITTTYTYDGANRLTDRSYSDGTADHFVLDDAGRITSATASRSGVVVARDYYPTGLIKSETTTWPFGISGTSTSAKVDYAYDAANRATTLTLPDGRTLDRTFTSRNELESLTIGGQAIATLGYDNAGRRTSALFGNGLTDARGYTDNNLLKTTVVGPAAAPLLSLEYAYDANNRKTAETDHRDGSRSISLGYDDADRLTSWTTGGSPKLPASQTWDLSAVGDWNKTTVDGVIENREHTPVHEIKTRNGVGVGYDPAGNLIRTDSGQTFAWDAENRLLAADTVPNADGAKDRAVYQTDAFGRRVAKSVYGSTSLAIHDGWQVVQELSGPTTLPASAAADDGSLANLATVPAGAILPTTYDAQGNPQYPKRINFQPATTPIPSGYLADKSKDFAARSNGLSYGWVAADGAPSRGEPVVRHFMPLPQYDTFVPTGDPGTWTWQIALPPGSYPVVLVLGDATNREHTFNLTVQGETFPDPHPYDPLENPGYEAGRFVGVAKQATVGADGLLTIQAAAGALNGTLCWLEVGAEGTQLTDELRQKLADEVTHANARTGGSPFWDGGRSETKTFVWGPGIDELMGYQRTTAEAGTTTYFVHGNQQWSVMAVTNESGQVVERFQYTATGKRASDFAGANGQSLSGLTTGFTGRNHDEATGTIYFRGREWEPDYQFMNRDPMEYVDGMSLYRGYFVPNAVDPTGKLVVFVHGIAESQHRRNGPAMYRGMTESLGWNRNTAMIHFLYGPAGIWDPLAGGEGQLNQHAATALRTYIDGLRRVRDENCMTEPIRIYAYSNGTMVTDLALRAGMRVDGVVFTGSPIARDRDMSASTRNADWIVNFYSNGDLVNTVTQGAGRYGFQENGETVDRPGLTNVYVSRVGHTGTDANMESWGLVDDETQWDSRYMGRSFYGALLSSGINDLSDHLVANTATFGMQASGVGRYYFHESGVTR